MATRRHGYQARRRRPRPRGWGLVLPLTLIVGAVALSAGLSEGGGALFTARSGCAGDGCEVAVLAAPLCAGGACAGSQVALDAVHETIPVQVTARAVSVMEEPCAGVLYESNAGARMAPASITKIATALVAAEHAGLSEMVEINVDGAALAVQTESPHLCVSPPPPPRAGCA